MRLMLIVFEDRNQSSETWMDPLIKVHVELSVPLGHLVIRELLYRPKCITLDISHY